MKKIIFLLLIIFLLASCQQKPKIVWENCHDQKFSHWFKEGDIINEKLECGNLEVPADYNKKNSEKITLALTRLPAKWENPIGSLISIMWWPGQSGINFIQSLWETEHSENLKKNFHIIWYAPRSIFPSMPFLDCGNNEPKNSEEWVKNCQKHTPEYILKNISTIEATEDINSIRKALWEEKISAIGFSYGTKVLSHFALKYPKNLRAWVLDWVVDINENYALMRINQEAWFQKSFDNFIDFCYESGNCFVEKTENFLENLEKLTKNIEKQNLVDKDNNTIDSISIFYMIYPNLYQKEDWENIIHMMNGLKAGNTEWYNYILETQEYISTNADYNGKTFSENNALTAINCADDAPKMQHRNKKRYIQTEKIIDNASYFDNFRQKSDEEYLDQCFYWPYEWKDSTPKNIEKEKSKLLFVSSIDDPTTPHINAEVMAEFFHNSPLLSLQWNNHAIGLSGRNICGDEKIANFLLNPENTIENTFCKEENNK